MLRDEDSDDLDDLERLARLHSGGHLSDQEYETAKLHIIGRASDSWREPSKLERGRRRSSATASRAITWNRVREPRVLASAFALALIIGVAALFIAARQPSLAEHQGAVASDICGSYNISGGSTSCTNAVSDLVWAAHDSISTERCLLSKFLNMTTYENFDIARVCGPSDEPGSYGDWFGDSYASN